MVTDVCQKVYGFPDVPSGMTFCTTKKDPSFIMLYDDVNVYDDDDGGGIFRKKS